MTPSQSIRRFYRGTLLALVVPFIAPTALAQLPAQEDDPMAADPTQTAQSPFAYPKARVEDIVDDWHGVSVADPYRWMEDNDDPELASWIEAQNELTRTYIDEVLALGAIHTRLTELWDHPRYGIPGTRPGRYFFSRNDGLQDQSIFYVADALDGEARVLLDPNTWSEDGTMSLASTHASKDGTLLAYAVSDGGSDWRTIKLLDVATGEALPDVIEWVKFSGVSWDPDGSGFYYSRYEEPQQGDDELTEENRKPKVYFHRIGTSQDQDELIYERPDQPDWGFGASVSEDERFLLLGVWRGTAPENGFFYQDREAKNPQWVELFNRFDASWAYLGNDGKKFYFITDKDAPKKRIVMVPLNKPHKIVEIIAEQQGTLESAQLFGNQIYATYLEDAKSRVRIFDLKGKDHGDLELPGMGSVWGLGGRRDASETFFLYSSFTTPSSIHHVDLTTGTVRLWKRPEIDVDFDRYEVNQVFYASKDGTQIPMFLVHKKDIELDGNNPTVLYGYGGFNIPVTPYFSVSRMVWLEMGGVFAIANLRGGGEYGEEWHQAGILCNKQNVFDDFHAAAEWLIEKNYTNPKRLAIQGRSNGGLLVGAAITQRPDLYGAALPGVGVLDMLRYHKFTIGWAWASDYGTADDPEQFACLNAYSPYHNLEPGTHYPATLVTTADRDDRVVPAHSFKFAAALQAAQGGPAPTLIRIEVRAGHGAGTPTTKAIDLAADEWAFLAQVFNYAIPEDLGTMP